MGPLTFLPHGGSRDDANKEDSTTSECVACWEDKDVLQEERVQLGQLLRGRERGKGTDRDKDDQVFISLSKKHIQIGAPQCPSLG